MGAPAAFDRQAVDFLRPRPALGRAQYEHRPVRAACLAALARGALNAVDLTDRPVERSGHLLVHLLRLAAFHETRFPAAAAEEAFNLFVAHAGEDGGVGDFKTVQMQDRQHRTVGDRVHEFVAVPRGRQRPGFGLAVADDAGCNEIGVIRHGAEGVGKGIAQFAALVDGAGSLGRHMAGNAAGEGEALEEPLHAILVARDVGVDFRVAAVQPVLRNHGVSAVAGAGEIDHVKVVALDDAIQVRVDEVLPRAGAPVADDGLLQVAFTQRALQKRVVEKIELAGGQIVCCAPESVDLLEFLR